jgi:hypothetical protein
VPTRVDDVSPGSACIDRDFQATLREVEGFMAHWENGMIARE